MIDAGLLLLLNYSTFETIESAMQRLAQERYCTLFTVLRHYGTVMHPQSLEGCNLKVALTPIRPDTLPEVEMMFPTLADHGRAVVLTALS